MVTSKVHLNFGLNLVNVHDNHHHYRSSLDAG